MKHHDLTSLQPLDGKQVMCTFDWDAETRSAFVTSVCINGEEVDAAVFANAVVTGWEADIRLEKLEEASMFRQAA